MPKAFSSRSVENAQVCISYKVNERLKYYEVTFRCIHGDKRIRSERTNKNKTEIL